MKIVADENIPGLEQCFASFAEIVSLPGRQIEASDVKDADALIVRSITQVNGALLSNSQVQFVGTCTIGTDHIDLAYLQEKNISFSSAPGCNADAVVDYVLAALLYQLKHLHSLKQKKVAVVGCGQVGGRLIKRLSALGIHTIAVDPFVRNTHASEQLCLSSINKADVICIHTPLTNSEQSDQPTLDLFNSDVLATLNPSTILLNAGRGKVVDNDALISKSFASNAVLDVYQEEPKPSVTLLDALPLATPHIAGYSQQGKLRGTLMIAEALYRHFAKQETVPDLLAETQITLDAAELDNIESIVSTAYDIKADSHDFVNFYKAAANNSLDEAAAAFDLYRKDYAQRPEWGFISLYNIKGELCGDAQALGFNIV